MGGKCEANVGDTAVQPASQDIMTCASIQPFSDDCKKDYPCLASCSGSQSLTTATKTLVCGGVTIFSQGKCEANVGDTAVQPASQDIMTCASIQPFSDDCKKDYPCLASCSGSQSLTTATKTLVCGGVTIFSQGKCEANSGDAFVQPVSQVAAAAYVGDAA